MDEKNIYMMIDSYLDKEMSTEEEEILFKEMSVNKEARDYYRNAKILKETIRESGEDFPLHLENQILSKVKSGNLKNPVHYLRFDYLKYLSLAVSVILLILSFYLFNSISSYKNEMKDVITKIDRQSKTIELLFNSMPTAEVQAKFTNEIIIKSKL